ncbi:type II toxin-antitoxin system RelE/ParE family toxin [Pseudoduganella aquatica]|uniref:type II toxin-antitoxin system RelE/ParE family toxin n=1 Tax=Pseudoduganella aquatica TaxID=2660641 RepID=UPI001E632749|nr:type II toxin-antitoxin system RelE/ParE family toxin [Pseudoduganella aquatica]
MVPRWRAKAVRDREKLFDFIAALSPQGALHVDVEISRAVALLAGSPELGRKGRVKATREYVVTPNLILVYRLRPSFRSSKSCAC